MAPTDRLIVLVAQDTSVAVVDYDALTEATDAGLKVDRAVTLATVEEIWSTEGLRRALSAMRRVAAGGDYWTPEHSDPGLLLEGHSAILHKPIHPAAGWPWELYCPERWCTFREFYETEEQAERAHEEHRQRTKGRATRAQRERTNA